MKESASKKEDAFLSLSDSPETYFLGWSVDLSSDHSR